MHELSSNHHACRRVRGYRGDVCILLASFTHVHIHIRTLALTLLRFTNLSA